LNRPRLEALDSIGAGVSPAARPLLLLGASVFGLLLLLQANGARADNCDTLGLRQICTSTGEFFCGGDRIAGCLHSECCPDAGCCLTYDQFGVKSAGCCPSGPDYDAACDNSGQCVQTCKRPCGSQCCLASLGEVCVPGGDPNAGGTCCRALDVCGIDTSSPACCPAPNVCTPSGTCCPSAGDVCGNDCCADGVCCNGECCKTGSACYGNRVCCAQSLKPCGDNCCAKNQKCHVHRRQQVCKCKKKGKKCGGVRCCAGDACLDGLCVSPLP
jgi:hypothetical protein